jgi:glycosyltransferase involved in cell wall biosynthesis
MIRSILTSCFLLGLALICFFGGAGKLQQMKRVDKLSFAPLIEGIRADCDLPVTEKKSFTIVLVAHNGANWCETALRSVFEQDYDRYRVVFVDDASVDGTLEKAQQFIVDNKQDYRVIAIRNDSPLGPIGSLYRAAEHCQDSEILVPLNAYDWFVHDRVLTRLNQVFQNPDVWIAFGQSIEYPAYRILQPPSFDVRQIERSGFRSFSDFSSSSLAFYASIFKSIYLSDLFVDGSFSQLPQSYIIKILEQSGGRVRTLDEPLAFANYSFHHRPLETIANEQTILQSRTPYSPLVRFPSSSSQDKRGVDLVIFSFDRPMQLFSALESIQRYLSGYQNLTVLYRVSDLRFDAAYNLVKTAFPQVRYIKQSDTPRKDFKPLLLRAVFDTPAEYIVFGVDDMIIKDFVDLSFCRQMVEKTRAYGFYLRFGRHIQQSYLFQKPQAVPPSVGLNNGVFAWDFRKGESDWSFANNLDMTLYRKSDLKKWLTELNYKHPNSLEFLWAQHPSDNRIGLYFEHSKMVNLPLNIVHPSDCPHMNFMTAEELLVKFNQGFKIDIEPLFQVDNPSPHYDYVPEFIPRS